MRSASGSGTVRGPLFVAVPARAGLLAVPAGLDKQIVGQMRSHAFGQVMLGLFADLVADVESGQVADRERAHRHTPFVESGIDVLHLRPLLNEEGRLAHVGSEHAVAHEAPAVADQDADFAEPLGQRHRRRQHFLLRLLAADDLEQFHHVGWAKKMVAHHHLRPGRRARNFVDVECRRVRGEHGPGLGNFVDLAEDFS